MTNKLNKIEVIGEYKQLQIREITDSGGYHRRVLTPSDDVSSEVQEIKDKAEELWTAEVKASCTKFKECKLGSLVVVNNGVIVGIITERDIIEKIILENKQPKKTKIEEIMSKNIITIHESAKIEQAAELKKKHRKIL